ncbi:MFS transporter [Kordiimonas lacus]|uniref:Predicted arabinose efflux permease, MFS family n=1 Tax=Kordiimonas lacus TaxID=637679 RepID=A0A1G6XPU6_9PROT|nr:MFS transporter [Kordiimonas lacus]SDD79991.1 Predicted arabinose efflux permease, MFS family [Kordiimonas lacus]
MPAILFAIFIDLLGFGIIVPILPFLVGPYVGTVTVGGVVLDEATLGAGLFSIYSLTAFAAGPLWGRLSDRIGRRTALAATFLGAMASYILLAFSDSLLMLFVARAFSGAMAGNVGIAMAAMADLTDESNRGRAMGLIGAVFGLGFAFGPLVGGQLSGLSTAGGGSAILLPGLAAACLSLIAAIMAYYFISETISSPLETEADTAPKRAPWSTFLKTPAQLALFSMFIVTSAGQIMAFTIMPFWTKDLLFWSQEEVGNLMGAIGLCIAAIQSLATGPLFKSIGELKALVLGGTIHLIGCMVIIFATPSFLVALIAFPLLMSGMTLSFPALNSLLSQRTDRRHQGAALGLSSGISALGRVAGPLAAGFLYTKAAPAPLFYAIALTSGTLLAWSFWELRKGEA